MYRLLIVFLSVSWLGNCLVVAAPAQAKEDWPRFGLIFQPAKDPAAAAQIFDFCLDKPRSQQIIKMAQRNPRGVYIMHYNLTKTSKAMKDFVWPDHDLIVQRHPDWILRDKKGSPVIFGVPGFEGPRLDIGNPQYVDFAIKWQRQKLTADQVQDWFGLDMALFGAGDKNWAKYDNQAAYHNAWEFFLRSLSDAFRPQKKILLNVGNSDLATFERMIRWVDGVLFEGLCPPLHAPNFNPARARTLIQDRWEKGKWCRDHDKVFAVQYHAGVEGITLTPQPGCKAKSLSVDPQALTLLGAPQEVVGKIDFTAPSTRTLAQVAQALEQHQIKAQVRNPYTESAALNSFAPVTRTPLTAGTSLKLREAPQEAFLFGYAATLMIAGPKTYYIFKGTPREYHYPEMDRAVGAPRGEMREVAPQVFRRDFQHVSALINLSDQPYGLAGSQLLPFRGALVPAGSAGPGAATAPSAPVPPAPQKSGKTRK